MARDVIGTEHREETTQMRQKRKSSSNNAIGKVLHCMNCPSNSFISNVATFCQENYSKKNHLFFVHQNKDCQPLMHDFVRCLNGSVFRCESARASHLVIQHYKKENKKNSEWLSMCFPMAWLFSLQISDIQLLCDHQQWEWSC